MRELSQEEIKQTETELLRHFRSVCEEHGIAYFLSNGTLLGAVKYGGFIPWDDDIDVLVPRADYDRLMSVYRDSARYKLFSPERQSDYRFTFAKLCDMSTRKVEENTDNGVEMGVDVDIFPLDCCTEHIRKPAVLNSLRRNQIACVLSKFRSSKGKPIHKKCIIDYCRFRGFSVFSKKIHKLVNRERNPEGRYKGCLVWPVYGKREIIPAEVFAGTTEVEFEGEKFPAPVGYDTYLRSLYGDYVQDPPIEKQKTHHSFKAYRL